MDQIQTLAADFRIRLDNYRRDDGLSLQSFPHGACGDASILLAHYLGQHGFGPFRYICGRRGDSSHVWLSDGNLIIDVTADQFEDFEITAFVSTTSRWHDALNGEDQHEATISVWGPDWEARFQAAYAALMSVSTITNGQ